MKLKKNQVIKNAKELGKILEKKHDDTKNVDTKVKRGWENELNRFCNWHKEGHKYVIDRVFKVAKEKVDGRGKSEGSRGNNNQFGKSLDILIMNYLQNTKQFDLTYLNIMINFGIISPKVKEFRDNVQLRKNKLDKLNIRNKTYSVYTLYMNTILRSQLIYTLNRLKKNGIINYKTYYMCYTKTDEYIEVLEEFNSHIEECKDRVNKEMEMNITEVMEIGGKTLKQFNDLTKLYLNENEEFRMCIGSDIEFVYEQYHVEISKDLEITNEQREDAKKELYSKVAMKLHEQLWKYYIKENVLDSKSKYEILTLDKILFANYDKDFEDVNAFFIDFGDMTKHEIREEKVIGIDRENGELHKEIREDLKNKAIRLIMLEKRHMQDLFDKELEQNLAIIHEKYAYEDSLLPF